MSACTHKCPRPCHDPRAFVAAIPPSAHERTPAHGWCNRIRPNARRNLASVRILDSCDLPASPPPLAQPLIVRVSVRRRVELLVLAHVDGAPVLPAADGGVPIGEADRAGVIVPDRERIDPLRSVQ